MIKVKEKPLLQSVLQQLDKINVGSSQEQDSSREGSDQSRTEVVAKRLPVVRKRWQQFKKFTLQTPISSSKVYYLFGFVPINENSVEDPEFQESLILNYVKQRVVQQVEVTKHAVVLQLSDLPSPNQPAMQYLIEKYMAKGDIKFYQIAQAIKQVVDTLAKLANVKPIQQSCDSYRQILRDLGDRMYLASFGANKLAFSKQLLQHLEYDPEEFAVEAIKYRSLNYEIFSSIAYPVVMKYTMQCLKNLGDLTLGNISYEKFLQMSQLRFQSFLVSKNNVKSYCDFCYNMITPSDIVNIIEKVHYKTDDAGDFFVKNAEKARQLEGRKRQHREEQYPVLLKLQSEVPRQKQAGYVTKTNLKDLEEAVKVEQQDRKATS